MAQPYINTLTPAERTRRDHQLDCPPSWGVVDDGEARQCPHGKWFVFHLTSRHVSMNRSSCSGRWSPATRSELRRIKRGLA